MGPDLSTSSGPSSCDRVNVIDFGLAKKYTNTRTGEHIKNSQCDSHGVGTPLFASINTHKGEGNVASYYLMTLVLFVHLRLLPTRRPRIIGLYVNLFFARHPTVAESETASRRRQES